MSGRKKRLEPCLQDIWRAQEKEEEARREVRRLIKQEFPIGATVVVKIGRAWVSGPVVSVPDPEGWISQRLPRIAVRNERTGKVRWISVCESAGISVDPNTETKPAIGRAGL